MIATGDITRWSEIFDTFPRSTVASAIGANYNRMLRLIEEPEGLTLEEMHRFCDYFKISLDELLTLIYNQIGVKKRPGKKK